MASKGEELRIVLVGNTGAGKSATGNSILMVEEAFEEGDDPVAGSRRSITRKGDPFNSDRLIAITDTPGLKSNDLTEELVAQHIFQFLGQITPGPHAIVIVVSCKNRVTQEIHQALTSICTIFGEGSADFIVFVFTNIDTLRSKRRKPPTPIKKWVESLTSQDKLLRDLLVEKCHNRFVGFNNDLDYNSDENKAQVQSLLDLIMSMMQDNSNRFFTSSEIKEVEEVMSRVDQRTGSRETSRNYLEEVMISGAVGGAITQTATGLAAGASAMQIATNAAAGAGLVVGVTASSVLLIGVVAGFSVAGWNLFKQMKDKIYGEAEAAAEDYTPKQDSEAVTSEESSLLD